MPDFKSVEDLKTYDFIALASITALAPLDSVNKFWHLRTDGHIQITILEQFKGRSVTLLDDPSFKSDCALVLQPGEQWLFFGTIRNGKMEVSMCGYTVRYRDASGEREWTYFTGIKQLDVLRSIYGHSIISNAVERQLYPNGKTEIEQSFKNGKLDGLRKIYHPDGKISIIEKFSNGERVDFRNLYMPSGQLRKSVIYKHGLIKQSVDYQDTAEHAWYLNYQVHHHNDLLFGDNKHDSAYFVNLLDSLRSLKNWGKEIQTRFKYTDGGRSYSMVMYGYNGKLTATTTVNYRKQIVEHANYYKEGAIQTYSKYDQKKDRQIEYDYAENGSRRDFLSTCESCKYYLGPDLPPAATPEKVYIQ